MPSGRIPKRYITVLKVAGVLFLLLLCYSANQIRVLKPRRVPLPLTQPTEPKQSPPPKQKPSPKSSKSPPPSCSCSTGLWQGEELVPDYLNLSVPWFGSSTLDEVRNTHPNIPIDFLYVEGLGKKCSLLPTIFRIHWRNRVWQQTTILNETFSLYSAFFDSERGERASLRLLGVSESKFPGAAWCQLWFSADAPPTPVSLDRVDYLDYQKRNSEHQMPYLLRCPLPPTLKKMPLAVSLSSYPCETPTNLLKVVGVKEQWASVYGRKKTPPTTGQAVRKDFRAAVCGPALFYYNEDFSIRLVEWLELLRAMRFERVFLYITDVHPNMTKVLHHYVREGFVHLTDYNYPPPYLSVPSLRRLWTLVERNKMFAQENIYFSDCVLRNMHQYRFIAHFDPDEVPILPNHDNISHLLEDLSQRSELSVPGFLLRRFYYYDNLPSSPEAAKLNHHLWALRHTVRQEKHLLKPNGDQFKPIFDVRAVRGAFSHGCLVCVDGPCLTRKMFQVPTSLAYHGHFSLVCEDASCLKNIREDMTLLKYKTEVIFQMMNVLKTLDLM